MDDQINIEISQDMVSGVFSNMAFVSHSPSEFLIDFIVLLPGMPKGKVVSRIILTPYQAKRLTLLLHDQIRRYENTYGEIKFYSIPPPASENLPPASTA